MLELKIISQKTVPKPQSMSRTKNKDIYTSFNRESAKELSSNQEGSMREMIAPFGSMKDIIAEPFESEDFFNDGLNFLVKKPKEDREHSYVLERAPSNGRTKLESLIPNNMAKVKNGVEYVVNGAMSLKKEKKLPVSFLVHKKNLRKKKVKKVLWKKILMKQ